MKKTSVPILIILLILSLAVFFSVIFILLGYFLADRGLGGKAAVLDSPKKTILRVALVADSENENDLLAKALRQAKGMGINFVIGLGDWSSVGTKEELVAAKKVFDDSKLEYFVTAGDHDLWESRNRGVEALSNFREVFGNPSRVIERENALFVIVDNSDIYTGISGSDWEFLTEAVSACSKNSEVGFTTVKKRSASLNSSSKLLLRLAQAFAPQDLLPQISGFYWRGFVMFLTSGKPVFAVTSRPCFVLAHKTPFHPESEHVMGEDSVQVAEQASKLIKLIEEAKIDGFFSGDLHFFAKFSSKGGSTSGGKSPNGSVRMTTIGAVSQTRNFQGPRFAVLTVFDDYSWEVEDVEIR